MFLSVRRLHTALLPLALLGALPALLHAQEGASLRAALVFHASFDQQLDADHAAGDGTLYTAPQGSRAEAQPGLPEGELVRWTEPEAGKFGRALQFTQKMRPQVFFRGAGNLNYQENGWSGACSFWMRISPDEDLEPGYCDPVQFVGQAWDQGNMFVEFTKENPRHFRYAMMALKHLWNPDNRDWEAIPVAELPMVQVENPPFSRDRWTHVVFTFENVNSGEKNGVGTLYLDGEFQGTFADREQTFHWDVEQSALTLGLAYIGYLDDVAVFNRALTPEEVRHIYALEGGVANLP